LKYGKSEVKILTQSNATKNRLRDSQKDTPVYAYIRGCKIFARKP